MTKPSMQEDEIARRAWELYEQRIRSEVESEHKGELMVINVESGEYVMDRDDLTAVRKAQQKFSGAALYTMRVGFRAAFRVYCVLT